MADGFDFQRLMTGFGGAFFGAVIGAFIGILIVVALILLNVGISNMAKLAIVGVCLLAGMVLLAIHEIKKHAEEHA
jgi:hypothetical protein